MDIFDVFINVSGTSFIPFVLIIKQSRLMYIREQKKKIKCANLTHIDLAGEHMNSLRQITY